MNSCVETVPWVSREPQLSGHSRFSLRVWPADCLHITDSMCTGKGMWDNSVLYCEKITPVVPEQQGYSLLVLSAGL